MKRPPEGICLKAEYVKCRDGDTVEIRVLGGGYTWPIRLLDCWAREMDTEEGRDAKRYAEQIMELEADSLHVWIPAPKHIGNLLKNLTFDRIPGHIFVSSDTTLSEMMVRAGHATKAKEG